MENEDRWLAVRLRRIANDVAELPGIRWLAKPLYRRAFNRPCRNGNAYYGIYTTYAEAKAAAPPALPTTFDVAGAGGMYQDRHQQIRVSDYPMVYWLRRLLDAGERRIFDLGGHIGVSYYGFQDYLDYPSDMRWLIHDVPAVVEAGRIHAERNDAAGLLQFTHQRCDADGHSVLVTSGALQYLEYTLPEFLQSLQDAPAHVLVNLTPMHRQRSFFTLQNIGKAVLPYRISAVPEFVTAMENLGYVKQDQWHSTERHLRIPFEPACSIDGYQGFYFRKS
ncbi:MAG: methyltransferase, TIGR04325 family [Luteimonas sp.]